jgi:hypothetical protein
MDTITSAWIREIRGEKWRIHGSTKNGGSAGLEAAGPSPRLTKMQGMEILSQL